MSAARFPRPPRCRLNHEGGNNQETPNNPTSKWRSRFMEQFHLRKLQTPLAQVRQRPPEINLRGAMVPRWSLRDLEEIASRAVKQLRLSRSLKLLGSEEPFPWKRRSYFARLALHGMYTRFRATDARATEAPCRTRSRSRSICSGVQLLDVVCGIGV
jgi:hypothetical protein